MSTKAKNYKNCTILLTGSEGFIGNELKDYFIQRDCNLITSKGDLSSKRVWEGLINENIDYIFHLAATEGKGKLLSMNSLSAKYLLEVCVEKKCFPKIIYASSTNLFGNISSEIIDEGVNSFPVSEYSSHKFLAENYFRYYYLNYKINSIILRIPNIYGPVKKKSNLKRSVINFIISKAILKGELSLFRNKNCLRDYVYIEDILEAFYLSGLVENKHCEGNFYVIGSDFKGTIEDICHQIKLKVVNVTVNHDDKYILEPMEFRNFTADSSLFKEVSNWDPKVTINQGLDLTIEFLKKGNLANEVLPL